jgi:peptidyl-prolyl cis-trans isomerase A (cyclophilin A)
MHSSANNELEMRKKTIYTPVMRQYAAIKIMAILLILSTATIQAQHIPEEVRINQYVKKYHPGAEPKMSGLYLIKITDGTGPQTIPGKDVTVHYEGKLLNLQQFDSSYDRGKPITFKLGEGRVIAGWEQALAQLRQGDVAVIIIPSYLAYGDKPVGKIPANSPLVFKIEVVKAHQ